MYIELEYFVMSQHSYNLDSICLFLLLCYFSFSFVIVSYPLVHFSIFVCLHWLRYALSLFLRCCFCFPVKFLWAAFIIPGWLTFTYKCFTAHGLSALPSSSYLVTSTCILLLIDVNHTHSKLVQLLTGWLEKDGCRLFTIMRQTAAVQMLGCVRAMATWAEFYFKTGFCTFYATPSSLRIREMPQYIQVATKHLCATGLIIQHPQKWTYEVCHHLTSFHWVTIR